jgi:hypothetical protein
MLAVLSDHKEVGQQSIVTFSLYIPLTEYLTMDTPNVPINFVPAKTGETFTAGNGISMRILEDGSRTGIPLPSLSREVKNT